MPAADSVSPRLRAAVIAYEDRTFHRHWGVSGRGIVRALRDNWRAGRVVSGGSTLTMQVARMARGNRSRNLWQKIIEAVWATRLEWRYDKPEILDFWLANAPFGGNVVGVEAACRRYYGRSPADLSWAEATTLAVLPNSPALIHPGRSRAALLRKRNALLDDLVAAGTLSAEQAALAKLEDLPDRPRPLPRRADHLQERLRLEHGPGRYRSSLVAGLQDEITRLVADHQERLAESQIHNVAALVTEVATGRVVAYVGNAPDVDSLHAPRVDMITAPRSPGSLLKPLLYGLAQDEGKLLPRQFLADVPVNFGGFQPANFYRNHDGAVPADEALARSLNVPFVLLLKDVTVPRFHAALRAYGFDQLREGPDHYGLSLILGGGEVTMTEINGWFLGLARQVRYFADRQSRYDATDFLPPTLDDAVRRDPTTGEDLAPVDVSAGAAYRTLTALTALDRPDDQGRSRRFTSHRPVAWKTGTSFGFRDAWAAGCTPAYAVTVWTGNADGTGRDGLVGVRAAAPLLFRIFRALEDRSATAPRWFEAPHDDLRRTRTCTVTGYLAGPECPVTDERVARGGTRGRVCPHHERIFTTPDGNFQVRQDCAPGPVVPTAAFDLPAAQAYYFRRARGGYRNRPPFHPDCAELVNAEPVMQLIYPYRSGVLSAARDWHGKVQPLLFELAHRSAHAAVHWYLDGEFRATTRHFHQLAIHLDPGEHILAVVDGDGQRLERRFTVR